MSVADASGPESGDVVFTVTLDKAATNQATVKFSTSVGGSDTASQSDFTAVSVNIRFAPGDTSKTVSVAIVDDSATEGDETFTVTLSAPHNAAIGTGTATGTINDDDQKLIPS